MESNSTHQVTTERGRGSAPSVITIPRWIEARDRRPGAERIDPSRSRFYVVSPQLNAESAGFLAHEYGQRERLERAHHALEKLQTPVLVATMALLVFLIVQEYSYWSLLLPVAIFIGHQFLYQDSSNDLRKPFDVAALEEHSSSRMFHAIPVNEYQAAMRVAKQSGSQGAEVHVMMWRAYELSALYARAQEDFSRLSSTEQLSDGELRTVSAKLVALQALAKDAHQALYALLNPRRHKLPTGRDGLLELIHRVDSALQDGVTTLENRVEVENQELKLTHERLQHENQSLADLAPSVFEAEVSSAENATPRVEVGGALARGAQHQLTRAQAGALLQDPLSQSQSQHRPLDLPESASASQMGNLAQREFSSLAESLADLSTTAPHKE